MKRFWIRWVVIVVVFFIALTAFSMLLNQGTTDMTIEMQEATLPVVSVRVGQDYINEMHGYVNRINSGSIRDSLTPMTTGKTLDFLVESYDTTVSQVRYEVRNKDGSRLIEDTYVGNYETMKGKLEGTLELKDLINPNEEYNLCIVLTLQDGRDVYYYTRVIINDELIPDEMIAFVKDFNNKSFDQNGLNEIGRYMEPNSEGNNTTFGKVDIHSSVSQLGWGKLEPRKPSSVDITINEMSRTMANITLNYQISVRSGTIVNYYNIEEHYIIKKSPERFFLIDFDRTMDDIIPLSKESVANNKIVLGIQSEPLYMKESEDGNIVAFENEGRLFCYDISGNKLASLYACYTELDSDKRNIYKGSKIKVLNVEETGNVSFAVYGYISRGPHEGEVGILVEYYNSLLNTVEEQAFISYDKSPKILINDVEKLCFLNSYGYLYYYLDGNLLELNMEDLKANIISDNIREDSFYVSGSEKSVVWQEGEKGKTDTELFWMDLMGGKVSTIAKNDFESLTPIGFMKEDLIYGISREEDRIVYPLGDIAVPMRKLIIQSAYGVVLKEYEADNIYVTEGNIVGNQISLKRVRKDENGNFIDIYDDQITNNDVVAEGKNKASYVATELFETITQLEMKGKSDTKTLKLQTPKDVMYEGTKNARYMDTPEARDRFFVYNMGHMVGVYEEAKDAVNEAWLTRGAVYDSKGEEVYKRGETHLRNQIMALKGEYFKDDVPSKAVCLDAMLKYNGISRNTEYMLARGDTPQEILETNLINAHVLNLTGVPMDMAFYYLDKDIPVMALMGDHAVLLIGYNELDMVWFDPQSQEISKVSIGESRDIFEQYGNRFMTYAPITVE